MIFTLAQRFALAWVALAALLLAVLWLLAPVLTPFVTAAVLAYALEPAVGRLVRVRVPRLLAVVLVVLAAIAAALSVLLLIVPILSQELPLLREQIPVLAERVNKTLVPWLRGYGIRASLDITSIQTFVVKYLSSNVDEWLAKVVSSARIGGSFVLALIGNAVLVPVVLFYLLADWPHLIERLRSLVPQRHAGAVHGFMAECDDVLGQYLRGQLLVMLVLAIYYTVALSLAGFDLALPVGVFTGLSIFVPYLGFGLGALLATLAAALQFASVYGFVAILLIYGVGQLIESFYLTPRLVGERIGLHPIAVIFALLAFGHLFGFVGVLIALPAGALTLVALRRLRRAYLDSPLFLR
jgi:predicted PurR-regulated permease PerM